MRTVTGLPTARGFAAGPAFVYRGEGDVPIPEYQIEPGCESDEILRLKRAQNETKRDLESLISVLRERTVRSDVMVFECHLMMLEDPQLQAETERHIVDERLNAEAAVRKTACHARAQFERMNDPYFRERVRDLDDIERRLLKALTGFCGEQLELKAPSVIVADDLSPAETVRFPRELVLGFATNGGSATSHVALLARAMGIPSVAGLGDITERVRPGETVLLDGTSGMVILNPDAVTIHDFGDLVERNRELSEEATSGAPAGMLKGGGSVRIAANVHPGLPLDDVRAYGASGIGLYRSEYLWLEREMEPSEDEQFEAYRTAAEFALTLGSQSRAVIRTLDIGGDKLVRGISAKEDNPFLGNRSIRYLLTSPAVFKTQLRAILRASACGRAALMFPMISCVEELKAALKILDEVRADLSAKGVPYDETLPVGAMIEVPAAALNAEALARLVDFFSIGTNDLVQYTMAADRGNEAVAHLYQPTNPAVIGLVRRAIAAAKRNGRSVGVCGESAADPIVGVLWAAMGADTLSMSPTYIPVMSKLLSRLTRGDLDEYDRLVAGLDIGLSSDEILQECRAWMHDKIPDLDNIAI